MIDLPKLSNSCQP